MVERFDDSEKEARYQRRKKFWELKRIEREEEPEFLKRYEAEITVPVQQPEATQPLQQSIE